MKQLILTFLWICFIPPTTRAGEVTVTCVWSGVCVLPCASNYHDVIHWYKDGKPNSVHTFYDEADQLALQEEEFKGRTSLFPDQILRGNVSLLLEATRTADEGTYKCYTATSSDNREHFVRLRVRAPVKEVDLKILGEEISCSTRDVYPEPKISWFRDGAGEKKVSVKRTGDKERLFSVSSVLPQTEKENITYSCSISLGDETQSYNASLRREKVVVFSGQDVSLHCPVSQETTSNVNITLMFGNSSTILTSSQTSPLPTETEWRGKIVRMTSNGTVSISGLKNSEDAGTYRCVRITPESRQEVLTEVQMTSDNQHVGAAVAVTAVVVMGIVSVVCWWWWRRRSKSSRHRTKELERKTFRNSSDNNKQNNEEGLLGGEMSDLRPVDVEDT